ncbi:MAG: 4-diphosphocytidyl-2C-methyl-D-erythritol kinase [Gammaproteobacteria bacterium]|nr:MAG: 4-diphosphocytidyl-2C-methyl-D-erythritol kinase [Gammaproteobacteria bacterium]
MEYRELPVARARGAILAHSVPVEEGVLRKGTVLDEAAMEALIRAGATRVTVAIPGEDDVGEDQAATTVAEVLSGAGVTLDRARTGRCNLRASHRGLLTLDRERLEAVNLVHEALTVATLPPFRVVSRDELVATIKVIPYAVPGKMVVDCVAAAGPGGLVRVLPFTGLKAGLIQTSLGRPRQALQDKTSKVFSRRLARLEGRLVKEIRCDHESGQVSRAILHLIDDGVDLIVVSGASAVVDRRDVVPMAVTRTGGEILHFGMPVDPGNLLLLARCEGVHVLGMPGCARSPKYNGFDMVLERLAAGLNVTSREIMRMGIGGLLGEIPERPQHRAGGDERMVRRARSVTAIVLAAGRSRRMGAANKLLLEVAGRPMVEQVVRALETPFIDRILVVTGHQQRQIEAALKHHQVEFVHNPRYREGLSTSLIAGVSQVDDNAEAVLVCLGDMPRLSRESVERLVAAFDPDSGREICVPVYQGKRGNPVLWSRRFLDEMLLLDGDAGARRLLYRHDDAVTEVEMPDAGVLQDFDTPGSLESPVAEELIQP